MGDYSLLLKIKNLYHPPAKNGIGVSIYDCVWMVGRRSDGDMVRKGRGTE